MNAAAPNPWKGFRLAGGGDKSVEVESIPNLIQTWIGFNEKPGRDEDWQVIVKEPIDIVAQSRLYTILEMVSA